MKTVLQRQDEGIARYDVAVQQTEKALELNEETNKLLKEILDALKNKS